MKYLLTACITLIIISFIFAGQDGKTCSGHATCGVGEKVSVLRLNPDRFPTDTLKNCGVYQATEAVNGDSITVYWSGGGLWGWKYIPNEWESFKAYREAKGKDSICKK